MKKILLIALIFFASTQANETELPYGSPTYALRATGNDPEILERIRREGDRLDMMAEDRRNNNPFDNIRIVAALVIPLGVQLSKMMPIDTVELLVHDLTIAIASLLVAEKRNSDVNLAMLFLIDNYTRDGKFKSWGKSISQTLLFNYYREVVANNYRGDTRDVLENAMIYFVLSDLAIYLMSIPGGYILKQLYLSCGEEKTKMKSFLEMIIWINGFSPQEFLDSVQ